jgi:glyoxylase-like metal-dependent hydrolase (beta-lactamase superfamily II)
MVRANEGGTMKMTILPAALVLAAACSTVFAKLQVKVYTSGDGGYAANSTLIYGDKDAILVDTQFAMSEAHKVAAMILESKKNLTTIYITHGHPDHYFGLAVMKAAFPSAKIVGVPTTVAGVKNGWEARRKFWTSEFGGNLPLGDPVVPEELPGPTLTLEGETLEITSGVMGDAPNNTFVWIPSLRAVLAGDIVFAGSHFTVPRMGTMPRDEWIKTLDRIAALKPAIVVPGHQGMGAKNDASVIDWMKKYMQDWDKTVASSKSADEVRTKMKKTYPHLALERLLDGAATAAFAPAKK